MEKWKKTKFAWKLMQGTVKVLGVLNDAGVIDAKSLVERKKKQLNDAYSNYKQYDVYFNYQSSDEQQVAILAERLKDEGKLKLFPNNQSLDPIQESDEDLKNALDQSAVCVVFLGPNGLGPWENEMVRSALDDHVSNKDFRIIPVLLPQASQKDKQDLPIFLRRLIWVDFRAGLDNQEEFQRLVAEIREEASARKFMPLLLSANEPPRASQSSISIPVNSKWPRKQPFRPRILIMKGGGVKGIAYVGALTVLEEYGYHFDHFVGTSAGAISAALLAVGYSTEELGEILRTTDFREFKDGNLLIALLQFGIRKGLYKGEAFRMWLETNLRKKFPQFTGVIPISFKHLKEVDGGPRRLTVFASSVGKTAVAFDSQDQKDSEREISFACRCSMAIPYFFWPEKLDGEWVVDGGMQNNYPVFALLDEYPELAHSADFIGLYLGPKTPVPKNNWLSPRLLSIWSESRDDKAVKGFIDRTIVVDPRPVRTIDFSLSPKDIEFLLAEGKSSALRWLYHWSDSKPDEEEVEKAEKESARLRQVITLERGKKFWPKLLMIVLLLLVFTAIAYK